MHEAACLLWCERLLRHYAQKPGRGQPGEEGAHLKSKTLARRGTLVSAGPSGADRNFDLVNFNQSGDNL